MTIIIVNTSQSNAAAACFALPLASRPLARHDLHVSQPAYSTCMRACMQCSACRQASRFATTSYFSSTGQTYLEPLSLASRLLPLPDSKQGFNMRCCARHPESLEGEGEKCTNDHILPCSLLDI